LTSPTEWPPGDRGGLSGRGERPGVYQRLGKRLAADAYRVRVVGDATEHLEEITVQVKALLGDADRPSPAVLVGSDSGALLALRLVARGHRGGRRARPGRAARPGPTAHGGRQAEAEVRASWPHPPEAAARHRARGVPGGRADHRADPDALREPVRSRQRAGARTRPARDNDQVSPLERVSADYAGLPQVELLTVADGRHDVLNAANHRSVAASVVLWLER